MGTWTLWDLGRRRQLKWRRRTAATPGIDAAAQLGVGVVVHSGPEGLSTQH